MHICHTSLSWSLCGSWISLRDQRGDPECAPWTFPPRHFGRIVPLAISVVIRLNTAVSTILWGSFDVYLHTFVKDGYFYMIIKHSAIDFCIGLLERLPIYLNESIPILLMENENPSSIRLLFQCTDRAPQVIVLSATWDDLYSRWMQISQRNRTELMEAYQCSDSENGEVPPLENFHDILVLGNRYRKHVEKLRSE